MDDILKALQEAGFKPTVNQDEDFPPFKGEYRATWTMLRPFVDEDTSEKTAYLATFKITQTLTGDLADNRLLSKFYRIGGNDFNGNPVDGAVAIDSLKQLCNDAFTVGVELDRTTTAGLERSFANVIDAPCFLRAWYFSPKADPDRRIQMFILKQEKQLRKESKAAMEGKTMRAPF